MKMSIDQIQREVNELEDRRKAGMAAPKQIIRLSQLRRVLIKLSHTRTPTECKCKP